MEIAQSIRPQGITNAYRIKQKDLLHLDSYFLHVSRSTSWDDEKKNWKNWKHTREVDWQRVYATGRRLEPYQVPAFAGALAAFLALIGQPQKIPLAIGAVAFDNSSGTFSNPDVTSFSYSSHSVTGSNLVALSTFAHHEGISSLTGTFNGTSMTSLGTGNVNTVANAVGVLRLIAPSTGSHTVVVGTGVSGGPAAASFATFTGADQTQSGAAVPTPTHGSSTSPTINITTTQDNSMVVSYCAVRDSAPTITNSEGTKFELQEGTLMGIVGSYRIQATAGATSSNWTLSPTAQWGVFDVEIIAAAPTTLTLSVSDSITVSEAVTMQVVDLVNLNESINLSEAVQFRVVSFLNVFDSVATSEYVSMANPIVFDSSGSLSGVGTSLSGSYTVTSRGNRTLFAAIFSGSNLFDISPPTYNGVTMIEGAKIQLPSGAVGFIVTYFLPAPATGANTFAVSRSGVGTNFVALFSSYYNVNQDVIDDFGTTTGAIVSSLTGTVTLDGTNEWTIFAAVSGLLATLTAGSGSTQRQLASSFGLYDSNGSIAGPGSNSMTVNSSSSVDVMAGVIAAISPFVWFSSQPYFFLGDDIFVTESFSLLIPLDVVSVSDSVTVSESVSMQVLDFLSVSDSVTVSENVQITEVYPFSVSDSVSVREGSSFVDAGYGTSHKDSDNGIGTPTYPTGRGQSFVSNGGQISKIQWFISKSGTPTGNVLAKIYASSGSFPNIVPTGTALATSDPVVANSLTTTDALVDFTFSGANAITLTNGTTYVITIEFTGDSSGNLLIGVDSTGGYANENTSLLSSGTWSASSGSYIFFVYTFQVVIEILNLPNVSDSVTVSENVTLSIGIKVNVNDTVTLTESPTLVILKFVNVFDSVTVSESPTIQIQGLQVFDTVIVSESTTVEILLLVSVSESVTVAEAVQMKMVDFESVNDSITVSEAVTMQVVDFVSVSDSVSVTENVTFQVVNFINVNDSITVSEAVFFDIRVQPNVFDSVTVSELAVLEFVSQESVSDSITVSEAVTIFLPYLTILVSDAVTISEATQFSDIDFESVFDSVAVSEKISIVVQVLVSASDSLTISDIPSVVAVLLVVVSDPINVSEFFAIDIRSQLSASDSVVISESVTLVISFVFSVSDSVHVSEAAIIEIVPSLPIFDHVTVSEYAALRVGRPPTLNFRVVQLAFPVSTTLLLPFPGQNTLQVGFKFGGYVLKQTDDL